MVSQNSVRLLRLFVASPSDVGEERKRLKRVVDEFNLPGGLAEQHGVHIQLLRWEDAIGGMGTPENVLLEQMPVNEWDIFVGILWTRFGSPTGNIDPETGLPFNAGTEEEFTRVYRSWKEHGKPHILFYRRTTPPPSLDDLDLEQYARVKKFLQQFMPQGDHPGLFTPYDTPEDFEQRVRQDLTKLLPRLVPRQQPAPLERDRVSGVNVTASDDRSVAIGGNVSGSVIITGDILFEHFAGDPLAQHIRVREFQTLVNERAKNFLGRDFIFRKIDELLKSPDFPSGYILIIGEPGIGKTALMAYLVKQRGYVHHFNISTQNIRHARDFLANVCAQLIVRYNLEHHILPEKATADSGFLLQLLAEASAKIENRPVVVLIDAIDEVEDLTLPLGINRLYLPQALPEGVFFILTARPQADYRLFVDHRKDIYIEEKDPNNLADVTRYTRNFLQTYADRMKPRIIQWSITEQEFVTIITEKSEGNFMYLRYILPDIRDGRLTPSNISDIRSLPQGLREYYQRHWRSMKGRHPDRFEKYHQLVVCILATVREPVTIEQIVEWTGLSLISVTEVINEWCEFLNVDMAHNGQQLYRLYHTSFQEFLRDEVGLKPYHAIIAKTALVKIRW